MSQSVACATALCSVHKGRRGRPVPPQDRCNTVHRPSKCARYCAARALAQCSVRVFPAKVQLLLVALHHRRVPSVQRPAGVVRHCQHTMHQRWHADVAADMTFTARRRGASGRAVSAHQCTGRGECTRAALPPPSLPASWRYRARSAAPLDVSAPVGRKCMPHRCYKTSGSAWWRAPQPYSARTLPVSSLPASTAPKGQVLSRQCSAPQQALATHLASKDVSPNGPAHQVLQ